MQRDGGRDGGGSDLQEDGTIKSCEALKRTDLTENQRARRERRCFETKLELGWIDADGNEIVQEDEVIAGTEVADSEVAGDENEDGEKTGTEDISAEPSEKLDE